MVKAPRKPAGGRKPVPDAARGAASKPPARKAKAAAADAPKPSKAPAVKASAPKRPPARAASKASEARTAAGPKGFGGWLWLLAIGQLLVTARMIDTLMKMAATIGTELWQDHPGLVIADLSLYGAALALQLAVIVMMVLGRRLFVPLFIASIAAYFLIGRIEPLLAIAFLDMDPAGLVTRPALVSMLVELAVGLAWGAYVLRSRRVRNTFVR